MIKRAGGCIAERTTGLCAHILIYTAVIFLARDKYLTKLTKNKHLRLDHRETVCWSELVRDGLKGWDQQQEVNLHQHSLPSNIHGKTFSKAMETLGLRVSLGMGKVAIHSAGHVFLIPNQESQRLGCRWDSDPLKSTFRALQPVTIGLELFYHYCENRWVWQTRESPMQILLDGKTGISQLNVSHTSHQMWFPTRLKVRTVYSALAFA